MMILITALFKLRVKSRIVVYDDPSVVIGLVISVCSGSWLRSRRRLRGRAALPAYSQPVMWDLVLFPQDVGGAHEAYATGWPADGFLCARAVQVPGAPVPELTFAALFVGRTLGVSFLRASSSSSRVCSRLPHALAFPLKLLPFFNCSQRSPSLVQVTHMHLLQPLFFSAQAPVTGVSFSDSSRLKQLLVFDF